MGCTLDAVRHSKEYVTGLEVSEKREVITFARVEVTI